MFFGKDGEFRTNDKRQTIKRNLKITKKVKGHLLCISEKQKSGRSIFVKLVENPYSTVVLPTIQVQIKNTSTDN